MTPEDYRQPLLDPPTDLMAASFAFAITSESATGGTKVRRGEDWRRSLHNATTQTEMVLATTVDDVIATARHMHAQWMRDLHLWSHDHESAYRQFLLDDPRYAYLILLTDNGPLLWRNNVLLFGAKGAVWGYGRSSDLLMHLARIILIMVVGHYVDDFTGIENAHTAMSAFESFEKFTSSMGRVGRAAVSPVFARHHASHHVTTVTLSKDWRPHAFF